MRVFPNFVKTTLREDREFYRAVVDAAEAGPDENQTRVLSLIKDNHLDHNRDLTTDLYHSFLVILDDLRVPPPSVKLNDRNLEMGSWFVIPGLGKTHDGKSQKERLARRRDVRQKYWAEVVESSSFTKGELDLLLANASSELGQMRDEVIEQINDLEQTFDDRFERLKTKLGNQVTQVEHGLVGLIEDLFQLVEGLDKRLKSCEQDKAT